MSLTIGPANPERTTDFEFDGWKFKFKAYDPYGFIKVTSLKDQKTLDGQFTSVLEAEKFCKMYVNRNKKEKI